MNEHELAKAARYAQLTHKRPERLRKSDNHKARARRAMLRQRAERIAEREAA